MNAAVIDTIAEDLKTVERAGFESAPPTILAPEPLPPELLPVEAFPIDALPDSFAVLVEDVSNRMQAPPDFVAVPLLVSAAALVSRVVAVRPKLESDWQESANLWAMTVSRPGEMKTPCLNAGTSYAQRLEAVAAHAFNAELKRWEVGQEAEKIRAGARQKAARNAVEKNVNADVTDMLSGSETDPAPIRRRFLTHDFTYEALGTILAANPHGVLCVRDELRSLLVHLEREEQHQARGFLLSAWSGGGYIFDRVGRGTITIPEATVSIVGGCQPGPLADLVARARRGTFDDGMLERFLFVWPDIARSWRDVDQKPNNDAKRAVWQTFERIARLTAVDLSAEQHLNYSGEQSGLPYLKLTTDARDDFAEWHTNLEAQVRAEPHERLVSALAKFKHHVPALALTLHVLDGGSGHITRLAMRRALALADYFESHTRRVHGSSDSAASKAARSILKKAQDGRLDPTFTARDVYRPKWSGLTDRHVVNDALDMLVQHRWLAEEPTVNPIGRPTIGYSLTEGAQRG